MLSLVREGDDSPGEIPECNLVFSPFTDLFLVPKSLVDVMLEFVLRAVPPHPQ